jgi:hypothetical protein
VGVPEACLEEEDEWTRSTCHRVCMCSFLFTQSHFVVMSCQVVGSNRTNHSSSSSSKAPANAPPASTSEGSSGANIIQKIRIATPVLTLN